MKKMKCPFCGCFLLEGEQKRYETLCEHVSNPNQEYYPLRDTWVCNCEKSHNSFWDWYGDFYPDHFIQENTNAIISLN